MRSSYFTCTDALCLHIVIQHGLHNEVHITQWMDKVPSSFLDVWRRKANSAYDLHSVLLLVPLTHPCDSDARHRTDRQDHSLSL